MNKQPAKKAAREDETQVEEQNLTCGIVMPIASIDGCDAAHWSEVRSIIIEAAKDAGFEAKIVSESDDVGVIHQRIVQNLYDNDIIVCDVSAKNANVMFELGLRLAFNKPAIILKDDKTGYSFDTGQIEHLEYPRDLHYHSILKFKSNLAKKIRATYEKSQEEGYKTFLDHFGEFKISGLETREVSESDYIQRQLQSFGHQIDDLSATVSRVAGINPWTQNSVFGQRSRSPDMVEIVDSAITEMEAEGEWRKKLKQKNVPPEEFYAEVYSRIPDNIKYSDFFDIQEFEATVEQLVASR